MAPEEMMMHLEPFPTTLLTPSAASVDPPHSSTRLLPTPLSRQPPTPGGFSETIDPVSRPRRRSEGGRLLGVRVGHRAARDGAEREEVIPGDDRGEEEEGGGAVKVRGV